MSRIFGHGDLRLYLIKLLDESPRHGYELITMLEERFLGLYSPSPGTIYPRLQALEQEGLIEVVEEQEGRKVYRLTAAGREELHDRAEELKQIGQRVATSARELSRQVREDVRSSVRDLRREIRDAAREARREERRENRVSKDIHDAIDEVISEVKGVVREATDDAKNVVVESMRGANWHGKGGAKAEAKRSLRSLQVDLEHFVSDVLAAARRNGIDRDRLAALREALRDARAAVVAALERGDEEDGR